MKVFIHRGSNEIGGTCIQISTSRNSILLDLGMPINSSKINIDLDAVKPDALIISHPHQDHYGLIDFLPPDIPVYIGALGKNLIDAARIFIGTLLPANSFHYFSNQQKFIVGDIQITPFLVDHSAVDSYAFLIEAEDKRIFYSGDFRAHGRKSILFNKIVMDPPGEIDLLFMEGTMIHRHNNDFKSESDVEKRIYEAINHQANISFLLTSSQNIDRIVSAYRACKRAKKTLIIDIYTAWVLELLKTVSDRVPNLGWESLKIYTPYHQDSKLAENPEFFGDFRKRVYKCRIKMEAVKANPSDFLFLGKMSHHRIIDQFRGSKPTGIIYSQWLGYLSCLNDKYYGAEQISALRNEPDVNFVYAHTSGHATVDDLLLFSKALNPRILVPIHTEFGDEFSTLFDSVVRINDGCEYSL